MRRGRSGEGRGKVRVMFRISWEIFGSYSREFGRGSGEVCIR